MSRPVKRHSYSSPLRQEQAARTRDRIIDAAGRLFEADGYARTSIQAIAESAGVAPDTVYSVFRSKPRVLTALIDARLAPGAANVMERPEALAVRAETDPRRQLHLFARDMAAVSARVRPVYEIMRTASAVESSMAGVLAEMDGYRLRNMRTAAEWFAARGPLRLSVDRAAETLWAVTSPDVGRMLCDVRGWSQAEHAAWLEDVLTRVLIDDAPGARTRRPPATRARRR